MEVFLECSHKPRMPEPPEARRGGQESLGATQRLRPTNAPMSDFQTPQVTEQISIVLSLGLTTRLPLVLIFTYLF